MLSLIHLTLTARLGGQKVDVLRDISLTLERGKVLGLVGESGAGKSMIGRRHRRPHAAGLRSHARPRRCSTAPTCWRSNRKAWRQLLGRRIAFIPQEPLTALNPVLTIGQTFDEHLAPSGRRAARPARADAAAARIGASAEPDELVRRYPHELSGGQCQRVLIAMAFAANPALIVADEPTTALDVVSQANVSAAARRAAGASIRRRCCSSPTTCGWPRMCATISRCCMRANRSNTDRPRGAAPLAPSLYLGAGSRHAGRARSAAPAASAGRADARCVGTGRDRGCRFAARCPQSQAACTAQPPALAERASGHWVRCIYPREVGARTLTAAA